MMMTTKRRKKRRRRRKRKKKKNQLQSQQRPLSRSSKRPSKSRLQRHKGLLEVALEVASVDLSAVLLEVHQTRVSIF